MIHGPLLEVVVVGGGGGGGVTFLWLGELC